MFHKEDTVEKVVGLRPVARIFAGLPRICRVDRPPFDSAAPLRLWPMRPQALCGQLVLMFGGRSLTSRRRF